MATFILSWIEFEEDKIIRLYHRESEWFCMFPNAESFLNYLTEKMSPKTSNRVRRSIAKHQLNGLFSISEKEALHLGLFTAQAESLSSSEKHLIAA